MQNRADEADEAVRAAVAAELRLLEPVVRGSAARVRELLAPDFVEFGASGRRWDREGIASAVSADGQEPQARITAEEITGRLLAPGLVHVTYVSLRNGRRVLRSSLWRETGAGWRLYFHQGTPAAG